MPIEVGVNQGDELTADQRKELENAQDRADAEHEKLRASQIEEERLEQDSRVKARRDREAVLKRLNDLAGHKPVFLHITRTQANPRRSTLLKGYMGQVPLEDIDNSVEDYIREVWGGGRYRVYARGEGNEHIHDSGMHFDIAGKSLPQEGEEESKEDDRMSDVLPYLEKQGEKAQEALEKATEREREVFLSMLNQPKDDGMKELLREMREDRRAAEEREARREERRQEREARREERRQEQMTTLLTTVATLAPTAFGAVKDLFHKENPEQEMLLRSMETTMKSTMGLHTSMQKMVLERAISMLEKTAQSDEENDMIGRISKLVKNLGGVGGLGNIGDILNQAKSRGLAQPRQGADQQQMVEGSTEISEGEQEAKALPLGTAPQEDQQSDGAGKAPTESRPASTGSSELLSKISDENILIVQRTRANEFLASLLFERRAGTDPEGAAMASMQFYKILPSRIIRVIEQEEEVEGLARIIDVFKQTADEQVLDAVINEIATDDDPEAAATWIWDTLGALLMLDSDDGSEEDDDQEEEQDEQGDEQEKEDEDEPKKEESPVEAEEEKEVADAGSES